MKLIVSGRWFSGEGLYSVPVIGVLYPEDLTEVEGRSGFLLLSYDLTPRFLGVPVKRSPLPDMLFVETGEPEPFETEDVRSVELIFRGSSMSEEEYTRGIDKVKDYIARGDVYQINLTNRLDFELSGDPLGLFLKFYSRQPVPYAFYLDAGDFFVLSGSMELFLKREGELIESRPIKGTGHTPEEILKSEKERAENLMITDMVRNDLGRVSQTGSVRVRELFKVERYETLCQMHSTVMGRTRDPLSEIIAGTFPPASVTGAPKYRAVQIIDELEPHARGYYCGSAGFVQGNGDFTLSVLIRTAYGGGSELSYFAGCGIVWDSDPEREWKELLLKTRAFWSIA